MKNEKLILDAGCWISNYKSICEQFKSVSFFQKMIKKTRKGKEQLILCLKTIVKENY